MKNKLIVFLLSLFILVSIIGIIVLFNFINKPTNPKNTKEKIIYKEGRLNNNFDDKNILITNYNEYKNIISTYNSDDILSENDFNNYNYLLVILNLDECRESITDIKSLDIKDNNIKLIFNVDGRCGVCALTTKYYYIRIDKNKISNLDNVDIDYNVTKQQTCDPNVVYKPVIYLYPTHNMNVNITVNNPNNLSVTYPKYNNGWNVYTKTNGDLIDKNGRTYYALYWEGLSYNVDNNIKEGFVVKGKDSAKFLEEKLDILGLNEREANEFIMYWLPILEKNEYNYIRFATREEIDNTMELNIEPKADTVIRVLMLYKPLDSKINVNEQELDTQIRKGFTVVEWGGAKLN